MGVIYYKAEWLVVISSNFLYEDPKADANVF